MRIDSHHHFWQPCRADYGWMPKDDPTLSRAYGPSDLKTQLADCGVTQTILVQAAPTVNETEYLLGIADATDFVAGVVGWVDFENPGELGTLERLAGHPKLRGVRPMVQDIADDDWLLRGDVQWAFGAIAEMGLTFDALGFPRHLSNFLSVFKRYPDMRVVIDHFMKPRIGEDALFQDWADGMSRIAAETSAYCKLSGLITEAGPDWSVNELRRYVEHVLDVFGPGRVMWGSDWPVCRLRAEYGDWFAAATELTAGLDGSEKDQVFGSTAAAFYRVSPD